MNRLLITILLSHSFVYAMHNNTAWHEEKPFTFFIEKKEYDLLAQKLCDKAYAECADLKDNEDNYKCKFDYYQTTDGIIADIQIIDKKDDTNPVCIFQYNKNKKELRKID